MLSFKNQNHQSIYCLGSTFAHFDLYFLDCCDIEKHVSTEQNDHAR